MTNYGVAWANMVMNLNTWADNNNTSSRVTLYAGWDMEPSWGGYSRAENFVDGYESVSGHDPILFGGSADGCPQEQPSGNCNNGYSLHDMWHLSYGHNAALPFPQVYNSTMAQQWQSISWHGYVYDSGQELYFQGALGSGSGGANNAHDWLFNALNDHSVTTQSTLVDTSLEHPNANGTTLMTRNLWHPIAALAGTAAVLIIGGAAVALSVSNTHNASAPADVAASELQSEIDAMSSAGAPSGKLAMLESQVARLQRLATLSPTGTATPATGYPTDPSASEAAERSAENIVGPPGTESDPIPGENTIDWVGQRNLRLYQSPGNQAIVLLSANGVALFYPVGTDATGAWAKEPIPVIVDLATANISITDDEVIVVDSQSGTVRIPTAGWTAP